MLDLDTLETIPNYQLRFDGKDHDYEPLNIILRWKEVPLRLDLKDPSVLNSLPSILQRIYQLTKPPSVQQAVAILKDFEEYQHKTEEQAKKYFGRFFSLEQPTVSPSVNTPTS